MSDDLAFRPDGVLLAVRVASWEDGISLWRNALVGDFFFQSVETRSMDMSEKKISDYDFLVPSIAGRRVGGRVVYEGVTAHLRWVVRALQIDTRPVMIPFREKGRSNRLLEPTIQNPFIGRFRGLTHDQVLADALVVDAQIDEHYREKWRTSWSALVEGSPLFEEDSEIGLMVVNRSPGTTEMQVQIQYPSTRAVRPRFGFPMFIEDRVTEAVRHLENVYADSKPRSWYVLPGLDADRWWEEHEVKGTLSIGPDEASLYGAVGHKIPYLEPLGIFAPWALERFSP